MDKDRFRENLGGLVESYREVAQRLGILVETDNALATGPRLVQ
jgi:phosphoribosylaminoimidazole-succinocarboxamide synthase